MQRPPAAALLLRFRASIHRCRRRDHGLL